MSELNLREIRKEKEKLKDGLVTLITQFYERTKVTVNYISLDNYTITTGEERVVRPINIDIKLEDI